MGTDRMHCQEQLLEELKIIEHSSRPIHYMLYNWKEGYSTSAHLPLLRQIAIGLRAKKVGEIGVGRSSFVLCKTCHEIEAEFICCDRYDYHYMFRKAGLTPNYLLGDASYFYSNALTKGLDFLFLDYMSSRKKSANSCYSDLKKALRLMKTNGIIAVHDAYVQKYNVGKALKMLRTKYKDGIEVLVLPYNYGLGLIRNRMDSPFGKITDQWKKKNDTFSDS